MKKYLAMLLAVVMVFALGASAFAADTGDTYSSYTFTDFNLTVQVSTTVEGLTLSGSGRSATIAPVTDHEMPQGFSLIFSNADGTNFDVNSVTVTTTNSAAFAFNTEGEQNAKYGYGAVQLCGDETDITITRDGVARSVHDRCSQTDRTGCGSGSRGVSARGWSVHERRRERLRLGRPVHRNEQQQAQGSG